MEPQRITEICHTKEHAQSKQGSSLKKNRKAKGIKNLVKYFVASLFYASACSFSPSFILDYIQIVQIQHAKSHTHTHARRSRKHPPHI